ncbi:hypothetical protein CEXT_143371 [Caerostris extrusa]|uniref:Uncharacterized protein n=1 Tax=Caerostris extrusa TaxID=172846 RepID=A0AAV4YDV4_CAEEX|nr:hypothetical protein CEXT_143371 [Caerostris extrusa]
MSLDDEGHIADNPICGEITLPGGIIRLLKATFSPCRHLLVGKGLSVSAFVGSFATSISRSRIAQRGVRRAYYCNHNLSSQWHKTATSMSRMLLMAITRLACARRKIFSSILLPSY